MPKLQGKIRGNKESEQADDRAAGLPRGMCPPVKVVGKNDYDALLK